MHTTSLKFGWAISGAVVVVAWMASQAWAQADYFEDFENIGSTPAGEHGPSGLIADGWIFRNQSTPLSSGDWMRWAFSFQGDWALNVDGTVSSWNGPAAEASSWAILPSIDAQIAGDVLRFYYHNTAAPPLVPGALLEIRYSPSGGTDTGLDGDDVGDFTELLAGISATSYEWTEHTTVLPGSGRIAWRYHIPPAESQEVFWGAFQIDTLSVGPDGPQCDQPAAPLVGQTIIWNAAGGPYEICEFLTIPQGSSVVLEPGAQLIIHEDASLLVEGEFIAQGTAELPAFIDTGWSLVTPPIRVFGSAEISFADVTGLILGEANGRIRVFDSVFHQGILRTREAIGLRAPQFVQVQRCEFLEGSMVQVIDGTLAIRDSNFQATDEDPPWLVGSLEVLRGYLLVDNVSLDGGQLQLIRERSPQTAYINNVSVTNNEAQAGFDLLGWDFFLGPDNVNQNNLFPLTLGGGLHPGGTLPLTGNIHNYIDGGPGANATVSDLGLPYVLDEFATIGDVTFLAGATIQFVQDFGLIVVGDPEVRFRGLPGNPVVFQRFDPAAQWAGILFQSGGHHKVEHTVIEGANIGVVASDSHPSLESCVLQNNNIGSNSNTFATTTIRKTQILNNAVGAQGSAAPVSNGEPDLFGQNNPNWIEGNGIGVQALNLNDDIEARYNYWGDPSGPSGPQNPGGMGDAVDGPVMFSPYLMSPPDFEDAPPVVHLTEPFFYAEPGDTSIVGWQVIEDGEVTSQRVLFTPASGHPFEVLADNLPGDQRALEFTMPAGNPGGGPNGPARIRVEATDDAGQIGWDQGRFILPNLEGIESNYTFTTPIPETLTPGEEIPICWQSSGVAGLVEAKLVLDADDEEVSLGGTTTDCLSGGMLVPYVSTDTARVALAVSFDTLAIQHFFSDYFSIRPDPMIADAPPIVQMLTPEGGESFVGGAIVPISWTASDDEALRSFDIQASYDGGRGWQFIATGLPPEADSFDWFLPPSNGVVDARVRVIARDLRFQNSSDGTEVVFTITPGDGAIPGDVDSDGFVNVNDLLMLLSAWGPCADPCPPSCPADFDDDCMVGVTDLLVLLANWS